MQLQTPNNQKVKKPMVYAPKRLMSKSMNMILGSKTEKKTIVAILAVINDGHSIETILCMTGIVASMDADITRTSIFDQPLLYSIYN
ncbi:MAG: hypothetical protein OEZ15_03795 [Gammaproteobacteria bacterium]|nr:hypothetical protein [Gammaproteobacteria bacterium]